MVNLALVAPPSVALATGTLTDTVGGGGGAWQPAGTLKSACTSLKPLSAVSVAFTPIPRAANGSQIRQKFVLSVLPGFRRAPASSSASLMSSIVGEGGDS